MHASHYMDENPFIKTSDVANSHSNKTEHLIFGQGMQIHEIYNLKHSINISNESLPEFPHLNQENQKKIQNQNLSTEKSLTKFDFTDIKAMDSNIKIDKVNSNGFSFTNNHQKEMNLNLHPNLSNSNRKKRCRFTPEEDEKLKGLVEIYGKNNWSIIASFMDGRQPRQCKERYLNYLVPGFFKGQWTNEEDDLLGKLYIENGPKWTFLQKYFPERNANSLKNRWKYFLCKQEKYLNVDTKKETEMKVQSSQNELNLIENEDFVKSFGILTMNDDYHFLAQYNDIFNVSFI